LFSSALGGYDYSLFVDGLYVDKSVGKIYLTVYLFISMIMLLNFLIAILSDTYANNITVGKALFLKEAINVGAQLKYHDIYACLYKPPTLLNFYVFLMMPFVVIFKSKKLNLVLLYCQYSLILVVD
jgi:hypothetical protein